MNLCIYIFLLIYFILIKLNNYNYITKKYRKLNYILKNKYSILFVLKYYCYNFKKQI